MRVRVSEWIYVYVLPIFIYCAGFITISIQEDGRMNVDRWTDVYGLIYIRGLKKILFWMTVLNENPTNIYFQLMRLFSHQQRSAKANLLKLLLLLLLYAMRCESLRFFHVYSPENSTTTTRRKSLKNRRIRIFLICEKKRILCLDNAKPWDPGAPSQHHQLNDNEKKKEKTANPIKKRNMNHTLNAHTRRQRRPHLRHDNIIIIIILE